MPPNVVASSEQIDALLSFMETHRDLALGQLRGAHGRIRAKRLWIKLTKSLNSLGNCKKSVEQWQRVWADRKHLTKKAVVAARWSSSNTGTSVLPKLSEVELKILSIVGEPPVVSLGSSEEPRAAAVSPAHSSSTSAESVTEEHPTRSSEDMKPNMRIQNQQRVFRRTRIQRCLSDRRIIELEEQRLKAENRRNRELHEIKLAIKELCNLVREYIKKDSTS